MKNRTTWYTILMFLPLVITIITLPFFPDRIPAHYDLAGNIDRWGSKYENFILPITVIVLGLIMTYVTPLTMKKDNKQANEKVVDMVGLASLGLFNAMTIIFLYEAYFPAKGMSAPVVIDPAQLIFIVMGLSFIVMGNYMPKCKLNALIGVRTTWSMKNERSWFLSQRFGGLSFVISGVLIVIGNTFLFSGAACVIFTLVCLIISTICTVIYSYYAYKQSIQEGVK